MDKYQRRLLQSTLDSCIRDYAEPMIVPSGSILETFLEKEFPSREKRPIVLTKPQLQTLLQFIGDVGEDNAAENRERGGEENRS
jgi:hypothetical protein